MCPPGGERTSEESAFFLQARNQHFLPSQFRQLRGSGVLVCCCLLIVGYYFVEDVDALIADDGAASRNQLLDVRL